MSQTAIKVYFMGSGSVGIPALQALVKSDKIELLGVASQPDRPAGRKKRLTPSPLAAWAESEGFSVQKPEKISSQTFVDSIAELKPDIIIVIAYGQLLRENLLTLAPFGCLNVHASILPSYRGASPIFSAVLNGDQESGISIMKMAKGMDTGAVYRTHRTPILDSDTTGSLEEKLSYLAAEHLPEDVVDVVKNGLEAVEQDHDKSSHCSKIDKNFGIIDWHQSSISIIQKIRACHPWPGTWTYLNGKKFAITEAKVTAPMPHSAESGTYFIANNSMKVACLSSDLIEVHRVKSEGKREMDIKDFLLGANLETGGCFSPRNT